MIFNLCLSRFFVHRHGEHIICLACNTRLGNFKQYSLQRHWDRKHEETDKISAEEREKLYQTKLDKYFGMGNSLRNELTSSEYTYHLGQYENTVKPQFSATPAYATKFCKNLQ